MNVLLVGSGGREHAIAWKLAQSPDCKQLWIAPGNAGTARLGQNVALKADDIDGLVNFAVNQAVDLVIVGPEVPLSLGLADALLAKGLRVFGPVQAAARIESSKTFSKAFMNRHGILTARHASFTRFEDAAAYLDSIDFPFVIKASGLAAGKGVILPLDKAEGLEALRQMMLEKNLGSAADEVLIEERLSGEEISLLAFSDGKTVRLMPTAQDHKRLLDGDNGPNTGGMGAYAPVPGITEAMLARWSASFLQPAIDGLRAEGMPFVGVLYAGLILTPTGAQVLEYNCRFGDPETQAILPLLDSDLLEICLACAEGRLEPVDVRWKTGSSACVVLAGDRYPAAGSSGQLIVGLNEPPRDFGDQGAVVFHAGTRLDEAGQVVTHGGRILGVTGWGPGLQASVANAYRVVDNLHFEGMQFRKDIARRALKPQSSAYAQSGVDIDAGVRAVELMAAAVRSTYTPAVLGGIGSFGGLYDASALQKMDRPVLVASTDGVGTKVHLAAQVGSYGSIGMDIVNHCIDDILVQGARPLFFLDYFATSRLSPAVVAEIVGGMAEACRAAGCALIGGETAEMPAVYQPGAFDVAGTIVGVLERDCILPSADIRPGDVLLGLSSSGPHTNGYSLIRKIFQDTPLDTCFTELGIPLSEALLAPHRSYLPLLGPVLDQMPGAVLALAHITGGGFIENIPRVLPAGLDVVIQRGAWPVPPLFGLIQKMGSISDEEMARVFNQGIGMVVIVHPEDVERVRACIPEPVYVIGEVAPGDRKVVLA